MSRFYWQPDDSCARCAAMKGSYRSEPERPHRFCDCHILAGFEKDDCYRITLLVAPVDDDPSPGQAMNVNWEVEVECVSGKVLVFEGEVSINADHFFYFDLNGDVMRDEFGDTLKIMYDDFYTQIAYLVAIDVEERATEACGCGGFV